MLIREATKEDVPKILPVWRELMDFHAERVPYYMTCDDAEEAFSKYVRENIEKDDACVFVAQIEDTVVAYCQCFVTKTPPVLTLKEYGTVADTAVLERYRRKGVGEQLVRRMMDWFQSKGLRRAEVRMSVLNEVSTRFWRKMGFQPFTETMCQSIGLSGRARQ